MPPTLICDSMVHSSVTAAAGGAALQEQESKRTPLFGQIPLAPVQAGALRQVTDAHAKVYACLCAHNRGKHPVTLSIESLIRLTGKGRGTVYRALAALEEIGLISDEKDDGIRVLSCPTSGTSTNDQIPTSGTDAIETSPTSGTPSSQQWDTNVPAVGIPTIKKKKVLKENKKRGTTDVALPATIKHFCDGWKSKYHRAYPFAGGKHAAMLKSLLKHVSKDVDEAKLVIDRFLANDENFVAERGHPVELLISQLTRYIVPPNSVEAAERRSTTQPRTPNRRNSNGPLTGSEREQIENSGRPEPRILC